MCYTSWVFFCNDLVANLVCFFVMLQFWGFEFATHLGFFYFVTHLGCFCWFSWVIVCFRFTIEMVHVKCLLTIRVKNNIFGGFYHGLWPFFKASYMSLFQRDQLSKLFINLMSWLAIWGNERRADGGVFVVCFNHELFAVPESFKKNKHRSFLLTHHHVFVTLLQKIYRGSMSS